MQKEIFFEDFKLGQAYDLGSRSVTREEIIEFASEFDPQPFHLDDEAGKASLLGGLSASGWHTGALVMRLLADGLLNRTSSQGSNSIDKLSWLKPVFPGDTLSATATVIATRELKSRPNLGIVTFEIKVRNQSGTDVMRQIGPIFFGRRTALASGADS
ncbi:MaoC family dehydratase [uncultured Roseibium sp.]|uniref:MaoC family dehydratase n=1 Tax=uncultured Roseibium sp. TaxID=1936171 RepID=UPI0032167473